MRAGAVTNQKGNPTRRTRSVVLIRRFERPDAQTRQKGGLGLAFNEDGAAFTVFLTQALLFTSDRASLNPVITRNAGKKDKPIARTRGTSRPRKITGSK